jgi:hypothetical protein
VQLQPKRQPGRTDRKAAAYASEIARLRDAGYTYEAIREALSEVGIELSTSALRREMRRLLRSGSVPSAPKPSPRPAHATPVSPTPSSRVAAPAASTSREMAEVFFNSHPSNPLLRAREIP